MIGIHEIEALEVKRFHRCIGLFTGVCGNGTHVDMFTVGFVPNRANIQSLFICLHDGFQLCLALIGETVTHTNPVFT